MKLVKVRIRRGGLGEPQMVYPARFNAEEIHKFGIGHINGNSGYSGHIGLGGEEEWTIIGLDDALADEYATDPDMTIITPEQADIEMDNWRILKGLPVEQVTDPVRLQAISTKIAAGLKPTKEDLDALNPDSDTPGINKLKKAADIVAKAATMVTVRGK